MNYLIHGGEFNNKGAEAMTLVAIDSIKRKDLHAQIYMVGMGGDFGKDLEIEYINLPRWYLLNQTQGWKKQVIKDRVKNIIKLFVPHKTAVTAFEIKQAIEVMKKIDCYIDISGFCLGDVWGEFAMVEYLMWIYVQKNLNPSCKIFLMPQSFGSFFRYYDVNILIKEILKKCDVIYAREKKGYDDLVQLGLDNVEMSFDSVLTAKDYLPSRVIKHFDRYIEEIDVSNKYNIVIVPNMRLTDKGGYNVDELLNNYVAVINHCVNKFDFFLVAHAPEDLDLCRRIKAIFAVDEHVHLVDHVMLSFNFERFVSKMSFAIASRFHSIVHAYRQATPAIVIGWSDKYSELVKHFKQEEYLVAGDNCEILVTLENMTNNYEKERIIIGEIISSVQEVPCYDCL